MRDITLDDTIYIRFTTRAFATGVPTTLAGTPVLSIYEEDNLVQITNGVSLTVDYDAVTGLNQAGIVASSGNGYEVGKSYDLVITTGTVSAVSVVGEVVGSFTVQASAAATDLANGIDGLGAIKAETALIVADTAEIGTAGAGLTNIGTIATVTNLTNLPAITTGWLTATGIAAAALNGKGDWNIGKTGYSLTQTFPANFADMTIEVTTGKVNVLLADTVTTLTNLPAITTNWLTAAGIAASALDNKGNWNVGKTGYSLTQTFPTNFADMSITITTGRLDIASVAGTAQTANDNGADINAILVDTGTTLPATLGTPAGADMSADIAAIKAETAAIVLDTAVPVKNAVFNNMSVFMVDSTDHVTPKTALTLTVTRSLDGGAFGAGTGTAAEIGVGMYQYDASAADMNADVIIFRFVGTAADDTFITVYTKP